MELVLSAVVAVLFVLVVATLWVARRRTSRSEFPAQGLLVPEDILTSVGASPEALWEALEATAAPLAVEYRQVTEQEASGFRTVPLNASTQQALVELVKALNPKGPTLYRVLLPKGAELVRAVGKNGFRGFSRTGGKTAQAVLVPVGAAGAAAASWPLFTVAATTMAVDMISTREQRAYQQRVEASLGRLQEDRYRDRIARQRSVDKQLSRAISLVLDGRTVDLELALNNTDVEFHLATQFLDQFGERSKELATGEGGVDYRQLNDIIRATTSDVDGLARELHLARSAIEIKRKALVADAAGAALADPGNPYTALKKHLDAEVRELDQADQAAEELNEQLLAMELTGPWHKRDKTVAEFQTRLQQAVAPPVLDDDAELRYLTTESGEILQVLPATNPEEPTHEFDESADTGETD